MFVESNAGLLTRVWQRFFDTDHSIIASVPCAVISARGSRGPNSPAEAFILELLASGSRTLNDMTGLLAEQLMREEIATGSWATDVAVWGPTLFQREAANLIEELNDDLLTIAPAKPVRSIGRVAIDAA